MKINTAWALVIAFLVIPVSTPAGDSCDPFLEKSEQAWMKLDYDASDRALDEAAAACPKRAEVYWRRARNLYDRAEMIPRDQKPPKDELLAIYSQVDSLAEKCMAFDPNDGNCWMWKAVAIGRKASTEGILQSVLIVEDMESALLKGYSLKPAYRSANGAADSMGDLASMLGIFYRVLPEWTCTFPFKSIIGACGDLDKSVAYQREAVSREPERIEYVKELGMSLMCRGGSHGSKADCEEARRLFGKIQTMKEFKSTDAIDKEHARLVAADPSLACGYSRDAQQDQSREEYEKSVK